MKKQTFFSRSLLLLLALVLLNCGKKKDDPDPGPVTPPGTTSTAPALDKAASATTPSDITAETAKVSSTLTGNGGAAITQHGHVWSDTKAEPTTTDARTELGKTDGPFPLKFTSDLKSLKANTTYNVRAYATNDKGTSYGAAVQVKTAAAPAVAGEISGTWVERAKFPTIPRWDYRLVSANNKLYLLCGGSNLDDNNSKRYFDAWEYDPATDKWTEKAKTSFASSAIFFPQVKPLVSATGKIFFPSGVGPTPFDVKANIHEFDPVANKWTVKGALPTDFDPAGTVSFVINDKAYFVGHSSSKGFVKAVWEYDIPTDKWLKKGDFPGDAGAGGFGASYKGKGLAIGMEAGVAPFTRTSWSYDPATDQWTTVGQPNVDQFQNIERALGFDTDKIVYYGTAPAKGFIRPQVLNFEPFKKIVPAQTTDIPLPQSCNLDMGMRILHVGQRTFAVIDQMYTAPSKWTACEKETGGKLYELVKK
jgi:N-acetylneuraminic acid mutarotase